VARAVLIVAFAAALSSARADARGLDSWPYKRLFNEADVVVIGQAVSVADSGETTTDNLWKAEFVGINTTFAVQTVLKGEAGSDKLQVLHYRLKPGVLIEDGPLLVSFRLHGTAITTNGAKIGLARPEYLLFLKKRKDGRYEPLSGRTDPALSVREMYKPLPENLGSGEPE
jgi:hypothetical protein